MTPETFHERIHLVIDRLGKNAPPHELFAGGVEDWHARARLAHFLAQMPEHRAEAIEFFQSVMDAEVNEELAQDVEEKVYAMQGLSALEAEEKETQEAALEHINLAIECAEGTDFLYKYILRGELWADRWNLMHKLGMTEDAEVEADERISAFVVLIAKDYMHMAIHAMEIPPAYEQPLAEAFAQTHENASWILREIDRATPDPAQLHWDI